MGEPDARIPQLRETVLQALRDVAARPEWDRSRRAPLPLPWPPPAAARCYRCHSLLPPPISQLARAPALCRACAILSGGLDSSIAACAGRNILGLSAAFTVLCTPAATDRHYAAQVAAALPGVEHHVIDICLEEALQELPDCVRVLQSFDPMTLRNDIAGERGPRQLLMCWGGYLAS